MGYRNIKTRVRARISNLLELSDEGLERQDWEIEIAEPELIDPILHLLEKYPGQLEGESIVCLGMILLASIDEWLMLTYSHHVIEVAWPRFREALAKHEEMEEILDYWIIYFSHPDKISTTYVNASLYLAERLAELDNQ